MSARSRAPIALCFCSPPSAPIRPPSAPCTPTLSLQTAPSLQTLPFFDLFIFLMPSQRNNVMPPSGRFLAVDPYI